MQIQKPDFSGIPEDLRKRLSTLLGEAESLKKIRAGEGLKQIREIVPIDDWLSSEYYIGSAAKFLYPFWKREISDFFTGGYTEGIISGGIGTGKSYAADLIVLRRIYELSCYEVPQRLFPTIADGTSIFMAYFSVSIRLATLTGFGDIMKLVDDSPYFQKFFKRSDKDSILEFPKNIYVFPGSDVPQVLSMALLGAVLDEVNFYRQGGSGAMGSLEKSRAVYSEVTDRRKSRFMAYGKDAGFSLLVSSSTHESSFVSERIKNKDDTTKVIIAKIWDVKPKGTYSDKKFFVFHGTEQEDAFIVEKPEDFISGEKDENHDRVTKLIDTLKEAGKDDQYVLDRVHSILPAHRRVKFSAIPSDFKKSFVTDIYSALKSIGGVTVTAAGKLFSSAVAWRECIGPTLVHPFKKETITLSVKGTEELWDYFLPEVLFDKIEDPEDGATWMLKRQPGEPRFVHIDQSLSGDTTGLAIVHVSMWRVDEESGMALPKLETDLMLQIDPPKKPDQISIAKIRQFIFRLRNMGMKFGLVTYDQYQSADSIQTLTSRGIPAERISVDKDDTAYLSLSNLMLERRLWMYEYGPFKEEFFNLDHDRERHKVDHPAGGDKGISDSMAGSVANALERGKLQYLPASETTDLVSTDSDDLEEEENLPDDWVLAGTDLTEEERKFLADNSLRRKEHYI
jgi:hypothetical protein